MENDSDSADGGVRGPPPPQQYPDFPGRSASRPKKVHRKGAKKATKKRSVKKKKKKK